MATASVPHNKAPALAGAPSATSLSRQTEEGEAAGRRRRRLATPARSSPALEGPGPTKISPPGPLLPHLRGELGLLATRHARARPTEAWRETRRPRRHPLLDGPGLFGRPRSLCQAGQTGEGSSESDRGFSGRHLCSLSAEQRRLTRFFPKKHSLNIMIQYYCEVVS